ncbi:MAG: hypothetical protein R2780_02325 [Crocinitomicaceae bacterium]|nr:hypothetical protein [Crocinitomicaceae bacterium]
MIKKIVFGLLIFCTVIGFGQDPEKGHELQLIGGYSFYAPHYTQRTVTEWNQMDSKFYHIARYGVGYTYRRKKLRHEFYAASYKMDYSFENTTGDFFGWTSDSGVVSQQWLEIGGYGGLKVMDSTRLYPIIGFSFGIPVAGSNTGHYQSGSGTVVDEDVNYSYNEAPTAFLDLKLGVMYNWQFKEKMGINAYLIYSRSLLHPAQLGNDVPLGKLKVDQFMFNLGLFYFIGSKE